MSELENQRSRFSDPQDAEVVQYRVVSGWAIAGLVLGILAPLALTHPAFWVIPAAGVLASLVALKRIADAEQARIGRKAAVVGLVVSVLFGAAACSQWFTVRRLVDWEARQFAGQWFELLRDGEPQKTYHLSEFPEGRLPLDAKLWEHYTAGSEQRRRLNSYLQRPEIRSLLALGGEADVRYYDTEAVYRSEGNDGVIQVYAVTCQRGGEKTSYFMRLNMKRVALPKAGHADWQMLRFEGGIRPRALGGDEESEQG